MSRVADWLRDHGEHLVFVVILGAMGLLGGWWSHYLADAVDLERDHALMALQLAAQRGAAGLLVGQDLNDDRLGSMRAEDASELAAPIGISGDAVDVDPAVVAAVNTVHRRRQWMVFSETAFLLLLLAGCATMLWRLMRAREAAQREVLLFTGQMTHEMKTPLVGLRALLETLQRGRVDDETLPELLAMGLEQIDREEHLVQTLLQAQRLRVAPDQLRSHPIDLRQTIDRLVSHRGGSAVSYRCEGAATAAGDPDALWTVLENLVDNAQKYGAKVIVITAGGQDRGAWITVTDDGRGFDPSLSRRLFQPFQSAHSDNTEHHGTGLGLYLSRRMARAMGGDLTGDSAGDGLGATFTLTLPGAD